MRNITALEGCGKRTRNKYVTSLILNVTGPLLDRRVLSSDKIGILLHPSISVYAFYILHCRSNFS